jgi:hypothetical protein
MKKFHVPTSQEVREYAHSINFPIDAERFIDYYEMVGWQVHKQPMKCWQAAVRTWKRNEKTYQKPTRIPENMYAPKECDLNSTLKTTSEAINAEKQRRIQAGTSN